MTLLMLALSYGAAQMAYLKAPDAIFGDALMLLAFFNLMAFVLNMLPVPGFDGFGVITPLLPQPLRQMAEKLERLPWLTLVTFGLIFFFGFPVIMAIMRVIVDALGLDMSTFARGFQRFRFWA
jgi:Zn-dependent protease